VFVDYGINRRRHLGFTLVEILVVMVILAIMTGIVATAVQGVNTTAKIARTRTILAIVDSVIQEQYESYKYRPFPVVTPDTATALPTGVLSLEIPPIEAARVQLNMLRDLQRMEMPERISDVRLRLTTPPPSPAPAFVINPPAQITAVARRVLENASFEIYRDDAITNRLQLVVDWFGVTGDADSVPQKLATYFERSVTGWTTQHESSECLYLILSTSFVGGGPAIELIPAVNVGDTDGDGMSEILDGWGRPMHFIRWPIGFVDAEGSVDTTVQDEFDPLKTDFGFIVNESDSSLTDIENPWSIRPLVISAGPDGNFGIAFTPIDDAAAPVSFRYRTLTGTVSVQMDWPIDNVHMFTERQSRTGTYFSVDPYLRMFRTANTNELVPGSPLAGSVEEEYRLDNISNYEAEKAI